MKNIYQVVHIHHAKLYLYIDRDGFSVHRFQIWCDPDNPEIYWNFQHVQSMKINVTLYKPYISTSK